MAGFWAFQTWFNPTDNNNNKNSPKRPEYRDKSTQVTSAELDEELKLMRRAEADGRRASFKSTAIAVVFAQSRVKFVSRRDISKSLSPNTRKRMQEVYDSSDLPERTLLGSVRRRTEKLVRNTSDIVDGLMKK